MITSARSTAHSTSRHAGLLTASCVAAAMLATAEAPAQSRRMVVADGPGGGQMMHLTLPDMQELRTPDFVLADLPDFEAKLVLAEPQKPVVEKLLNEYLAAFDLLRVEHLPPAHQIAFGGPMMLGDGGDHDHDHDDAGGNVFFFGDGAGEVHEIVAGAGQPGTIAIAVTAGGPGPGGGGGGGGAWMSEDVDIEVGADGPAGSVVIRMGNEDGEIPEEMRKRLEEHAQHMVEQLEDQLADAEAIGDLLTPGMDAAAMEDHMAYLRGLKKSADKFESAKIDLKSKFVTSVQSVLEDEQLERWPALDRTLTRKKTLPKGRINGERTDLVQVLDALELDPSTDPALAEQVDSYEVTLHEALVRRNAYVKDASAKVDEALQAQDTDEAVKLVDRATQMRLAVKNVNMQYAAAIAQHLGADDAAAFDEAVRKRSYPRVYRRTLGLRTFEAARKIEGLEDDTLMAILELEGELRRDLDLVNDEIRRAIDEHQPHDSRRAIARMGEGMSFGMMPDEDDPVRDAFKKRSDLEERHIAQLKNVLTPEQVEQLPKPPRQHSFQPIIMRRSVGDDN